MLLSINLRCTNFSQVFWKCYEYGDDLVQIFEFIDDQRAKSVREIQIPDPEAAEEFIDKHGSIVRYDFYIVSYISNYQK